MKIKNQVVSLELAKRLKELGVKQKSLFYYVVGGSSRIQLHPDAIDRIWGIKYPDGLIDTADVKINYSAFTVTELINLMPEFYKFKGEKYYINYKKMLGKFYCSGVNIINKEFQHHSDKNPVNAIASMLMYLLENKLLTAGEMLTNKIHLC